MKILFVHGTGVRRPEFEATFVTVRASVEQFLPGVSVLPCYWGDLGSDIGKGLSVPLYEQSKSVGDEPVLSHELESWVLLYDDPLIELRLLASKSLDEPAFVLGQSPTHTLRAAFLSLREAIDAGAWPALPQSQPLYALSALEALETFTDLDAAIELGVAMEQSGAGGLDPVRRLLARALTAGWMLEQIRAGVPPVPADVRDQVLALAFQLLGGGVVQTKGVVGDLVSTLIKPLGTLLKVVVGEPLWVGAAALGRTYRRSIAQGATPRVGDILLYQARGEQIRGFIAQAIEAAAQPHGEPVVILAHSLGGIACIDLLIANAQANVRGIVTVGSQAPFLYEIGALTQLQAPGQLPGHMPPWLNIYDQDDLLSFKAVPIMTGGNGVTDCEIRSHQPFPVSHSAYWSNTPVWRRIKTFVDEVGP